MYVSVICFSGSVLVYRNELYQAFAPTPVIVTGAGVPLTNNALTEAARTAYPHHAVSDLQPGATVNHAIELTLKRGEETTRRLFHPFTGKDLGDPIPLGFRTTKWLLDLHGNLLSGEFGRRVNGVGAVLLILLSMTGAVIWWPGIKTWRRSLKFDLRSSWKRLNWSLHSALGFRFFGFIFLWGVTGAYLSFPSGFAAFFDYFEPLDESSSVERVVDRIQYWLAYLHFGRLGGRGIPGCGRGLCDSITKAVWATAGLVPPVMFATGAFVWWNRVVRPSVEQSPALHSPTSSTVANTTARPE
jgi:uncharacterized iron-regulated membrane protein